MAVMMMMALWYWLVHIIVDVRPLKEIKVLVHNIIRALKDKDPFRSCTHKEIHVLNFKTLRNTLKIIRIYIMIL